MGGAAGPFMAGLIFDITGSYNPAFTGYIAICVVGIALPVLLKPTREQGEHNY